ncbi:hypothetical protein, partial [Enterobacter hormaechei]|uniref:hypothetical protein n=1 Tax=Enterobacter hormaechei TaxID=158836 RepID=UPI001CC242FA
KCNALMLENIGHHDEYLGKRKQRGQFQSAMKTLVNADVNGSLNIMRKVIGDGFIQDYLEHMELLTPKIINIV